MLYRTKDVTLGRCPTEAPLRLGAPGPVVPTALGWVRPRRQTPPAKLAKAETETRTFEEGRATQQCPVQLDWQLGPRGLRVREMLVARPVQSQGGRALAAGRLVCLAHNRAIQDRQMIGWLVRR